MVRARVWWGFAGLCAVAGSRWLLDETLGSGPLLPATRMALHDLVLVLVLGCVAGAAGGGSKVKMRTAGWMRIAMWAGLVFTVPGLALTGAAGAVTGASATLVFLLVPVVVVLAVAQQEPGFGAQADGRDTRSLLVPALAGVAGAALLLPFTLPGSLAGRLWLGALVVSAAGAGVGAVRLHALLRGEGTVAAAAVAAGIGALLSGAFGVAGWREMGSLAGGAWIGEGIAASVEGVLLVLSVSLLREFPPVAFAARYLLILLLSLVESFALMRPRLNWYEACGAGLMLYGAVRLLRAGGGGADSRGAAGNAAL